MDLVRQQERFAAETLFRTLFDAVPEGIVILNRERQIIFYNRAFRALCGAQNQLIGLRPGEALQCQHADEMPGGCGTTQFCQTCGAAKAIQSALYHRPSVQECRIVCTEEAGSAAMDLRVSATPFDYSGEPFVIFAVNDISHEKRRLILERIFFHDILNTAGAIIGVAQLLDELEPSELEELHEYGSLLTGASNRLLEEIQAQRQLLAAENGDLVIEPAAINSRRVLLDVCEIYQHHEVANRRTVTVTDDCSDLIFRSDPVLLRRILGNMTKNALEASPRDATVTLGCQRQDHRIHFWVHNVGQIPHAVRLQLFQRSFSTKGNGRGLGTYSIKLLAERYLRGQIRFTSSVEEGTTFYATFPLDLEML